jgi:two-component system response regulator MtrA
VRRVLRRIGNFAGPLTPSEAVDTHMRVNFPDCRVTVDDTPISLSTSEMKLLYILMRSAGETVPTKFILRRLWPRETPNEGRLRVYVHRLRQKIEISQPKHQYIKAMRGTGYCFAPFENAPAGFENP